MVTQDEYGMRSTLNTKKRRNKRENPTQKHKCTQDTSAASLFTYSDCVAETKNNHSQHLNVVQIECESQHFRQCVCVLSFILYVYTKISWNMIPINMNSCHKIKHELYTDVVFCIVCMHACICCNSLKETEIKIDHQFNWN